MIIIDKLNCSVENAPMFLNWIKNRGGIFVWRSVNLSNPGASWSTPAQHEDGSPYEKPTWQADSKPERHITDPSKVLVLRRKEVNRFYIAIQRGDSFNFVLTNGSSRKVEKAKAKAGVGSWHEFDGDEAVIFIADKEIPLDKWEKEQK